MEPNPVLIDNADNCAVEVLEEPSLELLEVTNGNQVASTLNNTASTDNVCLCKRSMVCGCSTPPLQVCGQNENNVLQDTTATTQRRLIEEEEIKEIRIPIVRYRFWRQRQSKRG
eukprot:gene3041-3502_t